MLLQAARKRQLPTVLALFLCLPFAACSRGQPTPGQSAVDCAVAPAQLQEFRVARVSDGDTLRLAGGDKVRLIGINTPELGHGGEAGQPLAEEARAALSALVADGRVWLQDGPEARDPHGRRLAWAFDARGEGIATQLLRQGLGFHVAIAPNTARAQCLAAAEAAARAARLGVWGIAEYRPRSVSGLEPGYRGFALLQDRVTRVSFKENGWWLQLAGKVGVKIGPGSQSLYSRSALEALQGQAVQVRGWLVPMRGGWWVLTLGHPSMLASPGETRERE
ncbi:thermonuclease family protein [Haliea sp. E17]|uniref:thermonuclease family protein n=1 Tax=Haliea sp. E17 TaxID=3401576 RepID=UPI003AACEC9A